MIFSTTNFQTTMARINDGIKVKNTPAMSIPQIMSGLYVSEVITTGSVRVPKEPPSTRLYMNSEYESMKANSPVATMLAAERGRVILKKT